VQRSTVEILIFCWISFTENQGWFLKCSIICISGCWKRTSSYPQKVLFSISTVILSSAFMDVCWYILSNGHHHFARNFKNQMNRRTYIGRVPSSEQILSAKKRAETLQSNFTSSNPSFIKIMVQSNVSGGFWLVSYSELKQIVHEQTNSDTYIWKSLLCSEYSFKILQGEPPCSWTENDIGRWERLGI